MKYNKMREGRIWHAQYKMCATRNFFVNGDSVNIKVTSNSTGRKLCMLKMMKGLYCSSWHSGYHGWFNEV